MLKIVGLSIILTLLYVFTPVGGGAIRGFLSKGYDGRFAIAQEGYAGAVPGSIKS